MEGPAERSSSSTASARACNKLGSRDGRRSCWGGGVVPRGGGKGEPSREGLATSPRKVIERVVRVVELREDDAADAGVAGGDEARVVGVSDERSLSRER